MSTRINIFTQTKGFFSWINNHPETPDKTFDVRPTHISLYFLFLNLNNIASWREWFYCTHKTAMEGTRIKARETYYGAIHDLERWGLIEYKPGANNFTSPWVKIIILSEDGDFLSEQKDEETNE